MYLIDEKLNDWKSLYDELSAAQVALRAARERHPTTSAAVADLELRVRRLSLRSDDAMHALDEALAAHKKAHSAKQGTVAAHEQPKRSVTSRY